MKYFTPYIKLLLVFLTLSEFLVAQVQVSHKSDWFFIEKGTNVHIKGQLKSLDGNTQAISNLGGMYISDSIICDGDNLLFGNTPDTVTANVFLNGSNKQIFGGSKNMRFGNLYIQNTYDSLEIWNNVEIFNFIQLDFGNIKLVSHNLDLLNSGRLIGETNNKRIYSNEYGRIKLARPLLSGTTYNNIVGTGLDLSIDGNLGTRVEVYRGNHQQTNASNGSIDRYFYFSPLQSGFVSKANIHYLDSNELNGIDENDLALYRSESSGATWQLEKSTVNTSIDKVNADPSSNFLLTTNTRFTLAGQDCDSLPPVQFMRDTIALCDGNSAYLRPVGIDGMASVWSNGTINKDSIQVNAGGTYSVTITDLSGCSNSDSVIVITAPNPTANFTVSPVCVGDTSIFKNSSTITSGTMRYFWELGDVFTAQADTTSDSIAKIVYTNQGTFSVRLTVTSNFGCVASISKNAISLPYPVVDFTVANSCEDSALIFTNDTKVTPNAGILYKWDFGNGDTSILNMPTYSFSDTGSKSIMLTATSNGCSASLTKNIFVNPNPIANFSAFLTCEGDQTNFTNNSTISTGAISSYWTFENNANTTLNNPSYTYSSSGIYPVNLRVTSNEGCIHDTTINVDIKGLPNPTFLSTSTCMGDSMLFTNTSNNTSAFKWNFNNQDSSNLFSPKYLFSTFGSKSVTLTETDTNGCINSISQVVNPLPRPTANFNVIDGCEMDNISFLNTSSTPSGTILYSWDFDNSNTSTLKNPTESFSIANTYNIELIASIGGCADTISKPLIINPKPIVNLGGTITTCANQYEFDALNAGANYLWSNNSTAQKLTTTNNGTYWVEVTNNFGCSSRDTVQLILNSTVTPNLGPNAIFCDNTTLDAGFPGATYLWNNSTTNQTLNITTSGTYWVEVTDQNNCVGRDTIVATIVSSIQPNLGPDLSECDGTVITLNSNAIGTYLWNDNSTLSTLDVSQTGRYWVELTDANGCVNRDTIQVTYNSNPILNLGLDGSYCDSLDFDVSQTNVSYLWENAFTQPLRTINTNGLYWVELTDLTTSCSTRDSINLTFFQTPTINLGNDTILCNGNSITLDAQNIVGGTYNWNVGGTSQTITVSSSGDYSVNVTTTQGCVGTDTINVIINPPLNTYLGADTVLCSGESIQISSPIAGANYQWRFNNISLPQATQSIIASNFGNYSVIVTDNFGCTAQDTITLLQTGSFIESKFLASTVGVYEGDTVQFINISNPSPFTSTWNFGDGASSIVEDPTHVYLSPGVYTVSLTVSNGICSDNSTKNILVLPLLRPNEPNPQNDTILNSFSYVKLYPNPNDGNFNLQVELLEDGDLFINIFSVSGRTLSSEKLFGKEFNLVYDNTHLASGMYIMRLRVNEEIKTLKFIKQ